ncbi:hypothetical protein [Nitratidesulfovibrio vulgaris]|jgi:hypothetical protein|uniref:Uncharacterized protein n=2 Tax=Nitratidesulfovibrio vulgaris TaxID=881 RepID=Q72CV7_NITV2|nr:hypothetical protein [Nitratidesulfovibrio vulgaris]GEB78930.1 hypothetical protein DDE01_03450 [Desulfovibrio desulfuricans]HBW16555.1 hypothetical protein [Desulfovibrio sp.]AAS95654.1 hypothetical protein DVU_1176 [Nitratidesulfovibrio vulgaris str. Hildenborough]ABM28896.1 conserved hypothetical protein [Nitratidesulfovibrio vulgaris DP4]ADP86247.1 hypothetical protein Deval_1086 [Nitratidesulfovibrio vulgaris RCH1]
MSEHTSEAISIQPYFDIELLMSTCQETRIGGDVMKRLAQRWEAWLPSLNVRRIDTGKIQYLAVWLDASVEDEVDRAWEEAPSDAFIINALAQTMCMSVVHEVLPEIEDAGCAPAPKPTEKLRAAMAAEGVPYNEVGNLTRRYAVVTHYPFKGGCEICHLQSDCPKGQGQAGAPSSLVLPGYEREN